MTEIEQQVINEKQTQVDLMEHGIVRACGSLIEELHAAVEDDKLTLDNLRVFSKRLNGVLSAYDKADYDLHDTIEYFNNRDKNASESAEVGNDNHE